MRRRSSFPQRLAAAFLRALFAFSLLAIRQEPLLGQEVLNNLSITNMVKALGEDTVLDMVRQHKSSFVTTPDELVILKRAGVSDKIIQAMITKNLASAQGPPPKPKVPQENGVYYKKGDNWVEVLTEKISWTGSGVVNTVRSVASAGMLKRDYSGVIEQASSRSMLTSPFELLIVTNNADIHNFLLMPLKRTKSGREVQIGPAKKGEPFKHAISYGVEKMGSGQFKLYFPSPLAPGEYGIVELSQISTVNQDNTQDVGRIYTFRVLL